MGYRYSSSRPRASMLHKDSHGYFWLLVWSVANKPTMRGDACHFCRPCFTSHFHLLPISHGRVDGEAIVSRSISRSSRPIGRQHHFMHTFTDNLQSLRLEREVAEQVRFAL